MSQIYRSTVSSVQTGEAILDWGIHQLSGRSSGLMSIAATDSNCANLETNGLLRSVVFPNRIRKMRKADGYRTLQAFLDVRLLNLTYDRLAKIERGEVVPAADELKEIARALETDVGRLLVDQNDPMFDRERWAREHIESRLAHRGGGIEAMKLGAALRVRRQSLGHATTDMKAFGLSAATVSRIENADRPIQRWDAATQQAIARVFGVDGPREVSRVRQFVDKMYRTGQLDETLRSLFSAEAIRERNDRRMRSLLTQLDDPEAKDILVRMDSRLTPVLTGEAGEDGLMEMRYSGRLTALPENAPRASIAVEVVSEPLGPGLPSGWILIAGPAASIEDGDVVVVLFDNGRTGRILAVRDTGDSFEGFSIRPRFTMALDELPPGATLMKMVTLTQ